MIRLRFPELARPGHLEVLKAIGKSVGSDVLGFGGGTALSLVYFGHRISMDLDFFVGSRDDFETGVKVVMSALRGLDYRFEPEFGDAQATMIIRLGEERLKVDVLLEALVTGVPCERLAELGVRVLPLETLASLKIKAALSRSELDLLKDLFDLLLIEGSGRVKIAKTPEMNRRLAGELLEALEQLDELIAELPWLRPQRGFLEEPLELLTRKYALALSLMRLLKSDQGF